MSAQKFITEHLDIWTGAVTKRSTSGRGSSSKIELAGINRLRELILELAVRGKLVEQTTVTETALELLERAKLSRERLVRERKIRPVKQTSSAKEIERPFKIPDSWVWANLPSVASYNPGKTPSTKDPKFWANGASGLPWISIADLNHNGMVRETAKTITKIAAEEVFKSDPVPPGVILMSFKLTVGKVSISEVPAYHNEAIISISPFDGILRDYLFKVLPMLALGGNTKQAIKGKTLNATSLAQIMIPIPPEEEQHRIVQKVDELMALCDRLEQQTHDQLEAHETLVDTLLGTLTQSADAVELADNWTRLAAHFDTLFTTEQSIDKLKQTILQLAVMGRLVEQDMKDEPANDYLNQLLETAQVNRKEKRKPRVLNDKISPEQVSIFCPSSWTLCHLGQLAEFENGDRSSRYPNSTDLVEDGVPFFGAKEIVDGKLQFTDELRYITHEKFESLSNGKLQDNDFVILLRGTVGKIARFHASEKYETGFINAQMLIIRLPTTQLADYFEVYSSSEIFKKAIAEKITGSAVKQMPASVLPSITFPLPPQEEQARIVQKVDQLMGLCDKLKERLKQANDTRCTLAEAVTKQAMN